MDLNILQIVAAKVVEQTTKPTLCLLSTESLEKQFIVIRAKNISQPLSHILKQDELEIQGTIRDTDAVLIAKKGTTLDNIRAKLITLLSQN